MGICWFMHYITDSTREHMCQETINGINKNLIEFKIERIKNLIRLVIKKSQVQNNVCYWNYNSN